MCRVETDANINAETFREHLVVCSIRHRRLETISEWIWLLLAILASGEAVDSRFLNLDFSTTISITLRIRHGCSLFTS